MCIYIYTYIYMIDMIIYICDIHDNKKNIYIYIYTCDYAQPSFGEGVFLTGFLRAMAVFLPMQEKPAFIRTDREAK